MHTSKLFSGSKPTRNFSSTFQTAVALACAVAFASPLAPMAHAESTKELSAERPVARASSSDDSQRSILGGPSLHLAVGFKTRKAPDLDEFYTGYGGVKVSLFSVNMGDQAYVSVLGLGAYMQRAGLFSAGLAPIIINHKFGVGLAVDFFPVSERIDRPAGPWGISLNFDIMRLLSTLGRF